MVEPRASAGMMSRIMPNTYTSLHYHIVFSTRNREPWISRD